MTESRVLAWVSGGAASVVAAKLAITLYGMDRVELVRCETANEDSDNHRFEKDASRWLGKNVTLLRSKIYSSVWDVWEKRRYMAGPNGAACTLQMKVVPRLAYQRPDDVHVFGYTADSRDVRRFEALRSTYFELELRAPLIEAGINKAATLKMIQNAGIDLPRTYALGFSHANCLATGCVKASSPSYWSLYREHFPDRFARTAALSREIGKRLVTIRGERRYLDELPADWPRLKAITPTCDFLCAHAEQEMRTPRPKGQSPLRRPIYPSSAEGVRELKTLLQLDDVTPLPEKSYEDGRALTISIARRSNPKMRCPRCSGCASPNGSRRVRYADIPLRGKPTVLQWDRQRFLCREPDCGRSFSDDHPAFHPTRQITLRLFDWIGARAGNNTFAKLAKDVGLSERAVAAISKQWESVCRERIHRGLVTDDIVTAQACRIAMK